MSERILVIKLSALGDFVLSTGAFRAIRRHHPDAQITLLTTQPYARLAQASGFFDDIRLDQRPKWYQPGAWLSLRRNLSNPGFDRVYDLQRSERSGWYFKVWPKPKPEWVGKVEGCSHRYLQPSGRVMHIVERERDQLYLAGIAKVPAPDLSFVEVDISRFHLPQRFALLCPGGAAHRPEKRWPAKRYAGLAAHLSSYGLTPVLIGAEEEAHTLREIADAVPRAINLCGETTLVEIIGLARKALIAFGNDTGPMHLIATSGTSSVVLFSAASDPDKIGPRGRSVVFMRRDDLNSLEVDEVLAVKLPMLKG